MHAFIHPSSNSSFLPTNSGCFCHDEQGEPSDSASLRGARAAKARALVFLGAAQRPMMVIALLRRTCLVMPYMNSQLRHITSNVLNENIVCRYVTARTSSQH